MVKLSLELGGIGEILKIRFSIIIEINDKSKIITKTSIDNNNFIKINPHPFITIDLKGKNEWSRYTYVNLNKLNMYKFLETLIEVRKNFNTKDLYMLSGNKLILNTNISEVLNRILQVDIDKVIGIKYATKYIQNNNSSEPLMVEAIFIFINQYNYGCILSLSELDLLIYTLKNINIDMMAMQLFELYLKMEEKNKLVDNILITKTIEEAQAEGDIEMVMIPQLQNVSEIPDI